MKTVRTAGGQNIWLLDRGERQPADDGKVTKILRQAADGYWYQIHPAPRNGRGMPRDPKTGDVLARGNAKVKNDTLKRRDDQPQGKGATTARAKRRRAPVEARSMYNMTSGGTQAIPLNKTAKRK